ncbi:MAG: hypothetical protein R3B48_13245 [Kofleriaceae bacterium]
MSFSRSWVLMMGVAATVAVPLSARAGGVAVESTAGARDATAAAVLTPIFEELRRTGYASGYDVIGAALAKGGSRPSQLRAGLPADYVERVDQAYGLWITGKFKEGIAALTLLVAQAHRSPASVVSNATFGPALFKAQVGLAMCHHRLGNDPDAWAIMAELVRSFEQIEVSKGQFGAEAYGLYQQVKREAREKATGGLSVRSTDATAAIYVNERFAQVGEYARADLIPGTYRVMAQLGPAFGRSYEVEVKAGARVELTVDPQFESALVATDEWTGLSFPDRGDREQREVELAAKLGTAMGQLGVVVVGIDVIKERNVAYGALVNASTGKEIRRASVVIDTVPPPSRLHALARFLVGEPTSLEGLEVHKVVPRKAGGAAAAVATREASVPSRWTRRRKLAAGVAALGLGVVGGGVVLGVQARGFEDDARELCPDPDAPCSDSEKANALTERADRRSLYANVAYGVGAAAVVGAVVLWFTGAPEASGATALAPRLAPGFAGIDLMGRF